MSATRSAPAPSNASTSPAFPSAAARRRRRAGASAVAVAVVLGTLATACGAGSGSSTATPATTVARSTSTPAAVPGIAEDPTDPAEDRAPVEATAPTEHLVVRSDVDLDVHDRPNGGILQRLAATNELGSPLALLVLDREPGWLQVLLPGRPTGATGWVRESGVELRSVGVEVHVDLAARTLRLVEDGETVLETPVAIGAPDAPTPTGRFSLTDKIASVDPDGAYGPFALGLSGRSEVLTDFAGGDGQIGIHGTNDPGSIGRDVSHGCVRVPNDVIAVLQERLPLGTPVVVS